MSERKVDYSWGWTSRRQLNWCSGWLQIPGGPPTKWNREEATRGTATAKWLHWVRLVLKLAEWIKRDKLQATYKRSWRFRGIPITERRNQATQCIGTIALIMGLRFWGHDGRLNSNPSIQTDKFVVTNQPCTFTHMHMYKHTHTPRSVCMWCGGIALELTQCLSPHLNYYIRHKLTTSLMLFYLSNPCKPTGCRCPHDRWNERYPNYWHHHSHPSLGHLCGRNGMGSQGMTASKSPSTGHIMGLMPPLG